ncbi:MAG TPA: hypothetical protein VE978_00670 [Chitinophagales bacterium]|nr:hypothetical protein [Chitinophagales bacterium]
MKKLLTAILLILYATTFGQGATKTETPIQTVDRIFKQYTKVEDNSPSQSVKDEMTKALTALQQSSSKTDLPLLLNVWMYFDPTDFPTRKLIEPILNKDKAALLIAIDKRLKKKRKTESKENAPYSDLLSLRQQLSK